MSLIGTKVAELNDEILRINKARRDGISAVTAAFERDKAAFLEKTRGMEVSIILRLHDFEDGEVSWVSRHPAAAILVVGIIAVVMFGLGIFVGRGVL